MKPLKANILDHTESPTNAHLAINTQGNSSQSLATRQVFNHVPKDTCFLTHKESTGPPPSVSVLFSWSMKAPQLCSANCAHSTSHVLGCIMTRLRKSADSLKVSSLIPSRIFFSSQMAMPAFSPSCSFSGLDCPGF